MSVAVAPPTVRRRELLTHSRLSAFKDCRRKHFWAYEIGLRAETDAKAMRMGSAFHAGLEQLGADCAAGKLPVACEAVSRCYDRLPDGFDAYWWEIERETVLSLVCGYQWRWAGHRLEEVATEQAFQIPLVNPATGKATPTFELAGKIDGIVRLEDGRLAVKESKTCSEDLSADSDYWRRLRIDHQITLYMLAARKLGYDVATVLYDVARKPAIQPTPVPLTDADGVKIVRDAKGERVRTKDGKKWRETSDSSLGYVLDTRPCTVAEWGERLRADIADRPEWYFSRTEIARLDQDLDEFAAELWDLQHQVRQAQLEGLHYRTVSRNCVFCPYFDPCSTNTPVRVDAPPTGFVVVENVHPELGQCQTESAGNAARVLTTSASEPPTFASPAQTDTSASGGQRTPVA